MLPVYVAEGVTEPELGSVENIQKIVKEKTPNFIVKPILYVVDKIDGFRESIKLEIEIRKTKTESEIKSDTEPGKENTTTEFFRAFKYLEVFILILLLFIFSIQLLYYAFVVFLILMIARFFWFRIY